MRPGRSRSRCLMGSGCASGARRWVPTQPQRCRARSWLPRTRALMSPPVTKHYASWNCNGRASGAWTPPVPATAATGSEHVLNDGAAPRVAAARVINAVLAHGRSLDVALATHAHGLADNDRALMQALVYGVLREYRYLATWIQPLLKRPPQPLLEALLLLGVYQLRAMRVPAHAAVHATVAAAPKLGLAKARGMVNA